MDADTYYLLLSGQMVEFIKEHPENEYFWEVKNENGEIGYVPSTHVLVKEQHVRLHAYGTDD